MKVSIYRRRRFHSDVIKRVIWLYFRFNLSLREIEEMMAERGVDVSYETIRRWIDSFGSVFAKRIKSRSEYPSPRWHLDEVYTKINGKMVYLWRAVQSKRNKKAAKRLLRKLLKNSGVKPERIVTDLLRSYSAALKDLNMQSIHDVGGLKNNRAENSHLLIRRRERKAQRFRSIGSAQKQLSCYGQIYNLFNHQRHLITRQTLKKFRNETQTEWNIVTKAVMG